MNAQTLLNVLGSCTLVNDIGIQNGTEVFFHLVGVDPDDMDECSDKGGEFERFLIAIGITSEMIMWNDCEGCYHEGSVNFDPSILEQE